MTARTYDALLRRAREELAAGRSVIVDATFARPELRARFAGAAARAGRPARIVLVTAPPALVRERMARRAGDPGEPSDADWQVSRDLPFTPPDPAEAPVVEFVSDGRPLTPLLEALMEGLGDTPT